MESEPSRYCLKCGYALVVATDNKCPECGQAFHPDHPITFANKPPSPQLKRWAISFAWAIACSSPIALILFLLPESLVEDRENLIMLVCLAILCLSVAAYAFKSSSFISLLGVAIGVFWGFLNTLNVAISIQNQRISGTNWPIFLLMLVVLPAAAMLLASPIWLFRYRILARQRKRILEQHAAA